MDTRAWHKVQDKQGLVLALTGDTLHHFSFSGTDAEREVSGTVISSWSKTVPLGAIKLFDVSHRRAARISERVCELHPPAEDPSPRPSPTGRGSINRRIRVVDVYRMARALNSQTRSQGAARNSAPNVEIAA